jgi:hypothetical protein
MKKLVMVDCLSQFRIRYCVEVEDNIDDALDHVTMYENDPDILQEFSQYHIGCPIVSHKEISEEEYIRMFDEDNDYLKNWPKEKKLKFINRVGESND